MAIRDIRAVVLRLHDHAVRRAVVQPGEAQRGAGAAAAGVI